MTEYQDPVEHDVGQDHYNRVECKGLGLCRSDVEGPVHAGAEGE